MQGQIQPQDPVFHLTIYGFSFLFEFPSDNSKLTILNIEAISFKLA